MMSRRRAVWSSWEQRAGGNRPGAAPGVPAELVQARLAAACALISAPATSLVGGRAELSSGCLRRAGPGGLGE